MARARRQWALCGYDRRVDLEEATVSLIALEAALEDGTAAGDGERRRVVAGYNEDDCRSTLALRDWLEERRLELSASLGEEVPRPTAPVEEERSTEVEVQALHDALLADVPLDRRTPKDDARILMADLLEWHRRDAKPGWWRFFHLHGLTD